MRRYVNWYSHAGMAFGIGDGRGHGGQGEKTLCWRTTTKNRITRPPKMRSYARRIAEIYSVKVGLGTTCPLRAIIGRFVCRKTMATQAVSSRRKSRFSNASRKHELHDFLAADGQGTALVREPARGRLAALGSSGVNRLRSRESFIGLTRSGGEGLGAPASKYR